MELVLERSYHKEGTNGALFLNRKFLCFSIELPWAGNIPSDSCIPEGTYKLEARKSKKFGHHILLKEVYNRQLILIHSANYVNNELRGCIAPVSELIGIGKGSNSREAMQKVLSLCHQAFARKEVVSLIIKRNSQESDFHLK